MIMAEILMYAVNARGVTRAFGNDIKSGKIAYQLNKPYNYYLYQVSSSIGEFSWKLIFLVPTGMVMGLLLLGPIPNFSFAYILPIFISMFLAVILTGIIYGTIGLLSFWIEEATPFTWIVQKFQMLFGLFFPPEFFPVWLQPIITYSPVYAMMSGPCKLLANFSWELFAKVTVSQVAYLIVFILLGLFIYNKGTKKVNVHGG
jgi:ABC-2 type transport system permease protein